MLGICISTSGQFCGFSHSNENIFRGTCIIVISHQLKYAHLSNSHIIIISNNNNDI